MSWSTEAVVLVPPAAPALVVADDAEQVGDTEEPAAPDEENYEAMCWSSGLQDDGIVLSLIRSLPPAIVAEQVHAYRNRKTLPAVADVFRQGPVHVGTNASHIV